MLKHLIQIAKITADFSHLVETEQNLALYQLLSSGAEIVHEVDGLILPPGYRLIRVNDRLGINAVHFKLALVNDVAKEVVYYNRVVTHNDIELSCRPISQVLVWRTRKPQHTLILAGLATKVFFEYLIKRYDVVVSDVNQTS